MLTEYLYTKVANQSLAMAIHITTATLLSILISYLLKLVLYFLQKHSKKASGNAFYKAFIHATIKPLSLLIIILGIALATEDAYSRTQYEIFSMINPLIRAIREASISVATLWFALLFIKDAEKNIIEARKRRGRRIDYSNIGAISKLLHFAVLVIAVITIMYSLGLEISGILTFGGLGGVVIGFAAKDTLANFFGLISIYLDKPFSIGEWIRCIGQSEIEGKVEKIGWRMTQIRRFDKRLVYVPNAIFATTPIENPSRMTHRRINEAVRVQYKDLDKIEALMSSVKEAIINHQDIDKSQTTSVTIIAVGKRILEFQIYCFIKKTGYKEYREVRQSLLICIAKTAEKYNFDMVLPTSTVGIMEERSLDEESIALSQ
jgi:MscS family membrane protein